MSSSKLTADNFAHLLDNIPDAVVAFDASGVVAFFNRSFELLDDTVKDSLINEVKDVGAPNTSVFWRHDSLVKKVVLTNGFAYLISPNKAESSVAEATLRKLTNALEDSTDIYYAAAKAIYECLSWRWVSITRFSSPNKLEVLASLDNNKKVDLVEYEWVGTPCQLVVETNRFTFFSDVVDAFPAYTGLKEMGAQTYAGLVYRGSDNQPLGHVMAIHDHRDVDFTLAEDVINIATLALSTHFQLHRTTAKLKEAQEQVSIDCLTGIGNRHAYEEALRRVKQKVSEGEQHWSLAIVDLDNLKPLNDNVGHNAGDSFIQLMAVELNKIGRPGDMAFRIGGDEFAIIFEQSGEGFVNSLMGRFIKAVERIRLALNFRVGASIGLAALAEVDGDIEKWISLADSRMYEEKQSKRA